MYPDFYAGDNPILTKLLEVCHQSQNQDMSQQLMELYIPVCFKCLECWCRRFSAKIEEQVYCLSGDMTDKT